MMIAQVMNVIHALCNNKSLPTRANIRKECSEGFNVKGALEYATGSGALTEEKLDEDRVYYPANEDMWVWLN
jgi:hypothetical protein